MFHMFEKINQGSPYLIAEMSANHAGKLDNALEIVRQSAKAGADCVKIQTYTADTLTIDCDREYFRVKGGLWDGYRLYDLYQDAGTPWEWQARIKEECEACGVDFLSTPFDATAVDFLEQIGCEAYKIASFELVDLPLIEYAASKGKPMIISCGMGSLEEIQDAVDACRRVGNHQIVLLKCCSEYPASWADMHLGNIPDMKQRFGVSVGLSDHSLGSLGAVVGVALGACVVEKHVCLSRKIKNPDSEFSMEMDEFAKMAQDIRNAKLIAQGPDYTLSEREKSSLIFRRSLFAVKEIRVGEEFTEENIRSIRPGYGLSPKYMTSLLGKKSKRTVHRGEPVTQEFLDETEGILSRFVTDRLILKGITEEDTPLIVKWRSDPEVYRYFLSPHPLTTEEHLDWYKNQYLHQNNRVDWVAAEKDTGKLVGIFGIKREKAGDTEAEVSYLLAPEFRRKGYAAEAVERILKFASEQWLCHGAVAKIHEDNQESIRFIGNLGFVWLETVGNFVTYRKTL